MRKFKFKLDKYLSYRKFQEKLQLAELAKALKPKNHYQVRENQYISLRKDIGTGLSKKMKMGNLDSGELRFYDACFMNLKKTQETSLVKVKETEPAVAKERERFQLAHNKVRVLESIREKERSAYRIEQEKVDEQELNEMNTRKYQSKYQSKYIRRVTL